MSLITSLSWSWSWTQTSALYEPQLYSPKPKAWLCFSSPFLFSLPLHLPIKTLAGASHMFISQREWSPCPFFPTDSSHAGRQCLLTNHYWIFNDVNVSIAASTTCTSHSRYFYVCVCVCVCVSVCLQTSMWTCDFGYISTQLCNFLFSLSLSLPLSLFLTVSHFLDLFAISLLLTCWLTLVFSLCHNGLVSKVTHAESDATVNEHIWNGLHEIWLHNYGLALGRCFFP